MLGFRDAFCLRRRDDPFDLLRGRKSYPQITRIYADYSGVGPNDDLGLMGFVCSHLRHLRIILRGVGFDSSASLRAQRSNPSYSSVASKMDCFARARNDVDGSKSKPLCISLLGFDGYVLRPALTKVFWFFFLKKNYFLA